MIIGIFRNKGWGWNDVLPIFKKSEDYQHGADHFHGSGGELRVEERRVNWEILMHGVTLPRSVINKITDSIEETTQAAHISK